MSRVSSSFALLAAALALSGCGKSQKSPTQGAGAPVVIEKAIYMSAADCADGGKLNADVCSILIERAVKQHEMTSPTFKSMRACEEASGPDRCTRDANDSYRMRLQAFMFEIGGPQPVATPLYPALEGKVGFRDAKKQMVAAIDDNLIVSQASMQLAYENSKLGRRKGRLASP